MLTHDEPTLACPNGPEQSQGAEVAVCHPHLILVDQRVDLVQQSTFLGVAILTQHHIGNGQVLLVEDYQHLGGAARPNTCSAKVHKLARFSREEIHTMPQVHDIRETRVCQL